MLLHRSGETRVCLNGTWEFAHRHRSLQGEVEASEIPDQFDSQIVVPFSPECAASGIGHRFDTDEYIWYRKVVRNFSLQDGMRAILSFEAVDWEATIFVNRVRVGKHTGGYLPFSIDITDEIATENNNIEIIVCAFDPSETGNQPRGKQRTVSSGIWYTAQSGIWQDVWIETVPAKHIVKTEALTDVATSSLNLHIQVSEPGEILRVSVLTTDNAAVATTAVRAQARTIELSIVVESPHLWSPDDPYLYRITMDYGDDGLETYCAFRSVQVAPDDEGIPRFHLNDKPLFLRGVLNQGYWEDSLMTAPSTEAFERDILLMKSLGFNMMRMHVKVEGDRFYECCDRLGMLVIQDLVSGSAHMRNRFRQTLPSRLPWFRSHVEDRSRIAQFLIGSHVQEQRYEWLREGEEAIRHLRWHPCIISWTLFNEGWGQFDARTATLWARDLDATRPIDATSGWFDQQCGDFLSVHDYSRDLSLLRRDLRRIRKEWKSGKCARALLLSEFGGMSSEPEDGDEEVFGYGNVVEISELKSHFTLLVHRAEELQELGLSGFVYTQLSDIEHEQNGLISYDHSICKAV